MKKLSSASPVSVNTSVWPASIAKNPTLTIDVVSHPTGKKVRPRLYGSDDEEINQFYMGGILRRVVNLHRAFWMTFGSGSLVSS